MLTNSEIIDMSVSIASANGFKGTYFLFVDFTRRANRHRLFLINVKSKEIVYEGFTSHGSGSGSITGQNLTFSNIPNSRMSSKGLMKANEIYYSNKFKSIACRLDGLEPGINDKVRPRAIVVHRGNYADDDFVKDNGYPGRSWGCLAVDPDYSDMVVNAISYGSLVYIHTY